MAETLERGKRDGHEFNSSLSKDSTMYIFYLYIIIRKSLHVTTVLEEKTNNHHDASEAVAVYAVTKIIQHKHWQFSR